jgi:tetratricopeptide (TPR) repeat protein
MVAWLLAAAIPAEGAVAACKIKAASLPVTMLGDRPLLPAKINGGDAMFMVDSGAFFSMITPASASKFKLMRSALPQGMIVEGSTGAASAEAGFVDVFTLDDVPIRRVQFVIAGGEIGEGAAGVIGQNILGRFDVDYDLAHGLVRLLEPSGCGRANLAYWAGEKPVSIIDLEPELDYRQTVQTKAVVYLNGVRLEAMLDTGAAMSVVSEKAAARAGVTPQDAGVIASGRSGGIAMRTLPTWLGRFASFKIGGEEARNQKITFGGLKVADTDILLGADFFLSHHVLVSNSQKKIYFTYNGGPIFALNGKPREVWGDAGAPPPKETIAEPTDAAGFALRGAASESRGDSTAAIADLSSALKMAPANVDYLYQRGRAYIAAKQPFLAMADFDRAIAIKPDDVPVLVARAALKLGGRDRAGALADVEAADKASAKQDDVRLDLGRLYSRADEAQAAITQFDLWLAAHPEAPQMPDALKGRCWSRALLGQDLDKALADCNRALRLLPHDAMSLDSRGLVHLRRLELDAAIGDYDASLAINPKSAWSLYGRGLAKQRKGDAPGAAADIAAALVINPELPDRVKRWGVGT